MARLILPSEILDNFDVVNVDEESDFISIFLDGTARGPYTSNPDYESGGFCEPVTIHDFPIRDKSVDLIVCRRRWLDRKTGRSFSTPYDFKAEGTRYSKEFAAFLKGLYGDGSYDLPFV